MHLSLTDACTEPCYYGLYGPFLAIPPPVVASGPKPLNQPGKRTNTFDSGPNRSVLCVVPRRGGYLIVHRLAGGAPRIEHRWTEPLVVSLAACLWTYYLLACAHFFCSTVRARHSQALLLHPHLPPGPPLLPSPQWPSRCAPRKQSRALTTARLVLLRCLFRPYEVSAPASPARAASSGNRGSSATSDARMRQVQQPVLPLPQLSQHALQGVWTLQTIL
jgi:hypothetical protein